MSDVVKHRMSRHLIEIAHELAMGLWLFFHRVLTE